MKKLVMLLCLALLAQGTVLADYYWNGGTSGDWAVASNWLDSTTGLAPAIAPGLTGAASGVVFFRTQAVDWTNITVRPGDTGTIYGYDWMSEANCRQSIREGDSWMNWVQQSVTINAGTTVAGYRFRGSNSGHFTSGTVNVYGTMGFSSDFQVGRSHYGSTAINQYAGSAVTGNELQIGRSAYRSVYTVYGGTLNVTKLTLPYGSSGYAQDTYLGSEITANNNLCAALADASLILAGPSAVVTIGSGGLNMTPANSPAPQIIIYAGTLKILGDKQTQVQGLIDSGNIIGDGAITYSYDGTYTIVVPEPATMLMLGLGSMCLIRRRK